MKADEIDRVARHARLGDETIGKMTESRARGSGDQAPVAHGDAVALQPQPLLGDRLARAARRDVHGLCAGAVGGEDRVNDFRSTGPGRQNDGPLPITIQEGGAQIAEVELA